MEKRSKLLIFLHQKKKKDGMFSVSSWFWFQFSSYVHTGFRITASATALVLTAHSEQLSPTRLSETTGKIVARRLQRNDIKRYNLIWRWVDFGIPVPGSTDSRAPRGFPGYGHDAAVKSVCPRLCVSLQSTCQIMLETWVILYFEGHLSHSEISRVTAVHTRNQHL